VTVTPHELRASLKGIVGFGVTPFHENLQINCEALRQNAELSLTEIRSVTYY